MKQKRDHYHNSIESRLVRIETRVCLIMEALGLDPASTTNAEARRRYMQSIQSNSEQNSSETENDQNETSTSDKRNSLVHKLIPKITRT